jgi:phytoene dehydrogenase-like protein
VFDRDGGDVDLPLVADAAVIGAGPNGLVAANALADAGWDVLVLEGEEAVGGTVRSSEFVRPGYVSDLFSAFYPLAAASPVIRDLDLPAYGLQWSHSPDVLAHPLEDGRTAVLSRSLDRTAENVESFAAGDGDRWVELHDGWNRIRDPLIDTLFAPLPPVRAATRLLRGLRTAGALEFARLAALPVRRMAMEVFDGVGARLLLTGNAQHSDIPPDAPGGGAFGWLMCMLGQEVGYPVPRGGAQMLSDAMRRRLEDHGGRVATGQRVNRVLVGPGGRAMGVRTEGGATVHVRHAVLADVNALDLYGSLLEPDVVPDTYRRRLRDYQLDWPTLKVNWALDRPIPWSSGDARGAGTVHLGVDLDGFVRFAADISVGRRPLAPFVVLGQMTTADPTRSPEGTESAWAYTHVPQSMLGDRAALAGQAATVRAAVERLAPGFESTILDEAVQLPGDLHDRDHNLVRGAMNGGTMSVHQQLFFRPATGSGRPQTPVPGLYLASASAHPGGGVHGACGWNAARAALRDAGPLKAFRRTLHRTLWHRLLAARE